MFQVEGILVRAADELGALQEERKVFFFFWAYLNPPSQTTHTHTHTLTVM